MEVERFGIDKDLIALTEALARLMEAAAGTRAEFAVAQYVEWTATPPMLVTSPPEKD